MQNKIIDEKLEEKSFLKEIVKKKKEELSRKTQKIQKVSISEDQRNKSFLHAMSKNKIHLIAEIKFASPTNASLGKTEDLLSRAKEYERSGADAISLITERHFFKGDVTFVSQIKHGVSLPVLQKDFVIDEKQIYEAKVIGSDALLLIARLVNKETLKKFVTLCLSLDIEPVVEINNEEDLQKAVATETSIIAVNARDLETFIISIHDACLLLKKIPDSFIKLGFSGIHSSKEVLQYKNAGAKGVLVGTSLMQAKDIKDFIESLHI